MNIFIPLLGGLVVGYLLRKRADKIKKYIDALISISVIALIFFMGIKTGELSIAATYLVFVSLILALLAVGITVFLSLLLKGWLL